MTVRSTFLYGDTFTTGTPVAAPAGTPGYTWLAKQASITNLGTTASVLYVALVSVLHGTFYVMAPLVPPGGVVILTGLCTTVIDGDYLECQPTNETMTLALFGAKLVGVAP